MNRPHILAVVLGVVLLVALGVPAWLLYQGIARFAAAESELENSRRLLRAFYDRDPFPSRENIRVERANVAMLDRWSAALVERLRRGQIEEEAITPPAFMTRYDRLCNKLLAAAAQRGVVVGDHSFGFQSCKDGVVPKPDEVPRLSQQLEIVRHLATLLIDAKAKEIVSLGQLGRAPAARGDTALYDRLRFAMDFKAKEETVWTVLNRLAGEAPFIVVTQVQLTKQGADVRPPRTQEQPAEPDRPTVGLGLLKRIDAQKERSAPERERPATLQERTVSGPTLEAPMLVELKLDVYVFHGGPDAAAGANAGRARD
jgi:hypothetical protein